MGKIRHFHSSVQCPRWTITKDTLHVAEAPAQSLTRAEVDALPEHIGVTYQECEGQVSVGGYDDPGRTYGDPYYCYPPDSGCEIGECECCGADDWSDDEREALEARARRDSDASD